MSSQKYTPMRRVVLEGNGYVDLLKSYLPYLTQDVDAAYHELMYAIIESIRYRDKAVHYMVDMYRALERNIDYGVCVKQELIATVKDFALQLYFQLENNNFYDDQGVLMFTYVRHPDPSFDDVMLTGIIQLTYNGAWYEPISQ